MLQNPGIPHSFETPFMAFAPDMIETLARARADLRMGVPIVLLAPDHAVVVLAIETLSVERLNDLRSLETDIDITLTGRRAETLKARAYDGDVARVALPNNADLRWVQSLADPAGDLANPMKGPFTTRRDGDASLHRLALEILKSARLMPAAAIAAIPNAIAFATKNELTVINASLTSPHMASLSPLHEVVSARVPIRVSQNTRLHVFRPEDGGEEHYAIEIGRPARDSAPLTRLHSACFTGDLLGSLKCDCGPQLDAALAQMGAQGSGILLYLNQEGRGIGLANKMRAYSLQDQGFDTVEANHRLGFEDDERDFRIGAEILRRLGFSKVRLLTNNPAKIATMEKTGITVTERVPLKVGENPLNSTYLSTKAAKSGHLL